MVRAKITSLSTAFLFLVRYEFWVTYKLLRCWPAHTQGEREEWQPYHTTSCRGMKHTTKTSNDLVELEEEQKRRSKEETKKENKQNWR